MLMILTQVTVFGAVWALIKAYVTIIFAIPAILVYLAYGLIIPPIVTFIILYIVAKKADSNKGIVCNVFMHLLMLFTFISINSNPGTDDSFANLDKVVNSAVYGSLFTMAAFILFVLYVVFVTRAVSKNNSANRTPKVVKPLPRVKNIEKKKNVSLNLKTVGMILIVVSVTLILMGGGIIASTLINNNRSIELNNKKVRLRDFKDKIYCSYGGMCYRYNGKKMEYYEDEDETEGTYLDYLWGKYKIKNNRLYDKSDSCKYSTILKWDKDYFTIKCGDYVSHYYNIHHDKFNWSRDDFDVNLTGKAFKNDNYELYFLTKNLVLFANKEKQCVLTYDFDYNGDEFVSFYVNHFANSQCDGRSKGVPPTFNSQNEEFLGFNNVSFDKLNLIDKTYYNNKNSKEYLVEGSFDKGSRNSNFTLKNNILTIKDRETKTYKLEVVYVYDGQIYYKNTEDDNYPIIAYIRKTDQLCDSLSGCFDRTKN